MGGPAFPLPFSLSVCTKSGLNSGSSEFDWLFVEGKGGFLGPANATRSEPPEKSRARLDAPDFPASSRVARGAGGLVLP